jgi:hypothetical protein
MQTVYAIKYDGNNKVIHAVTGENKGAEAIGLTFDASKKGFGQLLQKWNGENRVNKLFWLFKIVCGWFFINHFQFTGFERDP